MHLGPRLQPLAGAGITSNADHLSFSINAGTLRRRRVWEAWAATGRGGRRSALAQLGATIHAPALEDIKPYRTPAPMQIKQKHNGQGVIHVPFDPEDDEHTDSMGSVVLGAWACNCVRAQ